MFQFTCNQFAQLPPRDDIPFSETRHAARCRAICWPLLADGERWAAEVLNLSCRGIGLIAQDHVPAGTLLSVHIKPPCSVLPIITLVRTVYARLHEHRWLLGGTFLNPFTDGELRQVLGLLCTSTNSAAG
jgi:hypothetical protein